MEKKTGVLRSVKEALKHLLLNLDVFYTRFHAEVKITMLGRALLYFILNLYVKTKMFSLPPAHADIFLSFIFFQNHYSVIPNLDSKVNCAILS